MNPSLSIVRTLKITSPKLKICIHDMCRQEGKCGERLPDDMRKTRDYLYARFVQPLMTQEKRGEDKGVQTDQAYSQHLEVPNFL